MTHKAMTTLLAATAFALGALACDLADTGGPNDDRSQVGADVKCDPDDSTMECPPEEGDEGGAADDGDDECDPEASEDVDDCPPDDGTDDGDTDDGGEADLPYDMKLAIGDEVNLDDAFLEKGPLPAAIIEITMDDGDWRLDELQNGTVFTVEQADCDHEGNRDVGRDRIFVTWENADGSEDTDHLDMRYCEG